MQFFCLLKNVGSVEACLKIASFFVSFCVGTHSHSTFSNPYLRNSFKILEPFLRMYLNISCNGRLMMIYFYFYTWHYRHWKTLFPNSHPHFCLPYPVEFFISKYKSTLSKALNHFYVSKQGTIKLPYNIYVSSTP